MTNVAANALASWISIAGLWFLIFFLFRDYRIDLYRQRMFELRDRLFDWAAAGHINFDHSAYVMVRTTMNGFIRFAHRVSLGGAILARLLHGRKHRQADDRFEAQLRAAMRNLSLEQRQVIEAAVAEMNFLTFEHMIMSSPILLSILAPLALADVAREAGMRLAKRVYHGYRPSQAWMESLDSVALSLGESHFARRPLRAV